MRGKDLALFVALMVAGLTIHVFVFRFDLNDADVTQMMVFAATWTTCAAINRTQPDTQYRAEMRKNPRRNWSED